MYQLQWRHDEGDGVSNHHAHDCLLKRVCRHRPKKTSKLCVTGLCEGNSPVTGEFPAQRASNAENVFLLMTSSCPCEFLLDRADQPGSQTVIPNRKYIQCIPRNMHTVFALLCFVVVIHWLIFPNPSGLLHWHCGNLTIAPVPAKQPWWIWINTSCEFIMNDCITTTKQSTAKPCAYFLGYTVHPCYGIYSLTHWGRDKMAAKFLTISNAFSWMKIYKFRLRFRWSSHGSHEQYCSIGSYNGLAPAGRQTTIWANDR